MKTLAFGIEHVRVPPAKTLWFASSFAGPGNGELHRENGIKDCVVGPAGH